MPPRVLIEGMVFEYLSLYQIRNASNRARFLIPDLHLEV
jgi:hypothetical protein